MIMHLIALQNIIDDDFSLKSRKKDFSEDFRPPKLNDL
jgi:hypothetical protein